MMYTGQIENGQMHGKGTLIYPNSEKYEVKPGIFANYKKFLTNWRVTGSTESGKAMVFIFIKMVEDMKVNGLTVKCVKSCLFS